MRLLNCAAIGAALALSACATGGGGSTTPMDPVTAALNAAKQTVTAGHLGHQAAALLADAGAKSGLLKGTNAATAKSLLDESEAWLKEADTAIAAGDAATANTKAGLATTDIGKVDALSAGH